jgi:hypothetical protein
MQRMAGRNQQTGGLAVRKRIRGETLTAITLRASVAPFAEHGPDIVRLRAAPEACAVVMTCGTVNLAELW